MKPSIPPNADARRNELEHTLLTMTPSQDDVLRSLAWVAVNTDDMLRLLRDFNTMSVREEADRFPTDEVALLRRLVRIGVDRRSLWRLLVLSRVEKPLEIRPLREAVGEEVGGVAALIVVIEPNRDTALSLLQALYPEDEKYFALLKSFSKVDKSRLPKSRQEQPAGKTEQNLEIYRFAVSSVLMDTTDRVDRGADRQEEEVYEEEIGQPYQMPCYAFIDPPAPDARERCLTLRVIFPMIDQVVSPAEVVRIPIDRVDEFAKYLTLEGTTLPELARSGGQYKGEATMTMLVTTESGRGRLPLIYRKQAVR